MVSKNEDGCSSVYSHDIKEIFEEPEEEKEEEKKEEGDVKT